VDHIHVEEARALAARLQGHELTVDRLPLLHRSEPADLDLVLALSDDPVVAVLGLAVDEDDIAWWRTGGLLRAAASTVVFFAHDSIVTDRVKKSAVT
jgi:hypothetical protein